MTAPRSDPDVASPTPQADPPGLRRANDPLATDDASYAPVTSPTASESIRARRSGGERPALVAGSQVRVHPHLFGQHRAIAVEVKLAMRTIRLPTLLRQELSKTVI